MPHKEIGSLEDIWPLQAELNRRAGFDTRRLGTALADALAAECHELHECLSWKHWYREAKEGRQYELRDVQNARVEVTDMLFFWVSLCQLLGLAPADVYRLYAEKLGINHRRQDEDRTQGEHADHEAENRRVV